ncbi:hypothetical protein KFK09_017082 [Dendrobium nobile]|uniref:Uncharacterized protein n=1 Tax=Dendrobium nobile TaxID=94219 RepID=A0A8T3B6G7_DENNO|nr:hypothetical protein KFK09_017082 [Dendrobium nobile]
MLHTFTKNFYSISLLDSNLHGCYAYPILPVLNRSLLCSLHYTENSTQPSLCRSLHYVATFTMPPFANHCAEPSIIV